MVFDNGFSRITIHKTTDVFLENFPVHSSLSLLKNYEVSMVQSTDCIIILVPIPSFPKPPFLTALMSCKHSCRFSPLQNTGYPMRKLTIHCENCSPIKRQGKLPLTQHNITPLLYKMQLSKQITFTEAWYLDSSHSQILPLPHFYIPQNVNPHNKTPALQKFSP